jgi:hypothetical protein
VSKYSACETVRRVARRVLHVQSRSPSREVELTLADIDCVNDQDQSAVACYLYYILAVPFSAYLLFIWSEHTI